MGWTKISVASCFCHLWASIYFLHWKLSNLHNRNLSSELETLHDLQLFRLMLWFLIFFLSQSLPSDCFDCRVDRMNLEVFTDELSWIFFMVTFHQMFIWNFYGRKKKCPFLGILSLLPSFSDQVLNFDHFEVFVWTDFYDQNFPV
jgi:hypothetical protein